MLRKSPLDSTPVTPYSVGSAGSGSRYDVSALTSNPHPSKRKKSTIDVDDNDMLNLRDSGTSYYSLPSSHQSFSDLRLHLSPDTAEHVSHESDVPTRKDKGKAVDRGHISHSGSSRRDRDVSTDDARRSKHQERADKHVYFGPLAHAEFERMKREIENLKKAAQENNRKAKRQTKVCTRLGPWSYI